MAVHTFEFKKIAADNKGFTLLELLIAFTILAVVVLIVFSALHIGIRAWEKGEKGIEEEQQLRIVLDAVKQQITSINLQNPWYQAGHPFILMGDQNNLIFCSQYSWLSDENKGNVNVFYMIKHDDQLNQDVLYGQETIRHQFLRNKPPKIDGDPKLKLLDQVEKIKFSYLKMGSNKKNDMGTWQDEWQPEKEKTFPRAVKISVWPKETSIPFTIIARIDSKNGF